MSTRSLLLFTLTLLCVVSPLTLAQNKMLTVEDIFDPVKRVNFNGNTPTIRWLKDGKHFLLTNDTSRRDVPRLQKVDAATGANLRVVPNSPQQTICDARCAAASPGDFVRALGSNGNVKQTG